MENAHHGSELLGQSAASGVTLSHFYRTLRAQLIPELQEGEWLPYDGLSGALNLCPHWNGNQLIPRNESTRAPGSKSRGAPLD